jgi:hypothetical protein
MFDTLATTQEKTHSTTRERLMLVLMVLVISAILFAALYFGVQSAV